MQPVMRRRRQARYEFLRNNPGVDPFAQWPCARGGYDPTYQCRPARPDLGLPELQPCGYRNRERARAWTGIRTGYGVGSAAPELSPGECVTHLEPRPHTHCAPHHPMHPEPHNYMNLKNLEEIAAYAQNTRDMLLTDPHALPGWATHFLSVARSRMGDVKHFVAYHQRHHGDARMHVYRPSSTTGYAAGRPSNGMHSRMVSVRQVRMPWPNAQGIAHAKPGMRAGDEFVAVLPDGTQRAMVCFSAAGHLYCALRSSRVLRGMSVGGLSGAPSARYGGLTSASAKSASRVRRYNMLARRQHGGMSVGAPVSQAQATALRSVLTEHGYSAGGSGSGCGCG